MFWTEERIFSFQDMRTMFGQWFLLPFMTTERVATTSSCVYDKFWTERMHIERKLERSFIDLNENICLCFTIDVFFFSTQSQQLEVLFILGFSLAKNMKHFKSCSCGRHHLRLSLRNNNAKTFTEAKSIFALWPTTMMFHQFCLSRCLYYVATFEKEPTK